MDPLAQAMKAAADEQEAAKAAAEAATKEIEDWLVQCQWHAEVRKMIEDTARLGTGSLKGPVPAVRRRKAISMQGGAAVVSIEKAIVPESRAVDPWNFTRTQPVARASTMARTHGERDTITRRLRDQEVGGYLPTRSTRCWRRGP